MRARSAASAAVIIAAVAALLTGCSLFMQPETQQPYDPSDGINVEIGELALRNVMVVADDAANGNLLMTAINGGETDLLVNLQYETDGTKHSGSIQVPAGATVQFGFGASGQLLLEDLGVQPGSLLDLYVQFGDEPGKLLKVPVVDGTLPQYSDYVPTPAPTPVPLPSVTDAPQPTETPAP